MPSRKARQQCVVDRCPALTTRDDGLCHTHYEYCRRNSWTKKPYFRDDLGRFMANVRKDPGGCWIWTGAVIPDGGPRGAGYGRFKWSGTTRLAHRASYELLVGQIPDGLQIDHLCFVRSCVNPEHLQPVTARENLLRSPTASTLNIGKTHCIRGHEFTVANTYTSPQGKRDCRACRSLRLARYRARMRSTSA